MIPVQDCWRIPYSVWLKSRQQRYWLFFFKAIQTIHNWRNIFCHSIFPIDLKKLHFYFFTFLVQPFTSDWCCSFLNSNVTVGSGTRSRHRSRWRRNGSGAYGTWTQKEEGKIRQRKWSSRFQWKVRHFFSHDSAMFSLKDLQTNISFYYYYCFNNYWWFIV